MSHRRLKGIVPRSLWLQKAVGHDEAERILHLEVAFASGGFEVRDGEVFDGAFGQTLEENQFLARLDEHLVHRDATEDGSEGRDVAHGQSVGKFAYIKRGAEHVEVEGTSWIEHADATEREVLATATAIAARLEVEAVVGRSEYAVVHIDAAYHASCLGAKGDAAGATFGQAVAYDDILGGTTYA